MPTKKPKTTGEKTQHLPTPLGVRGRVLHSPSAVSVEEIKKQIDNLTKVQRKEVADYLLYLNLDKRPTKAAAEILGNRDTLIWADCLSANLDRVLKTGSGSFVRTPANLKQLDDSSAALESFIKSSGISVQQTYHRKAFYEILARLLVSHCRDLAKFVKAPLTLKFCMQQTDKVAGLFENAYPGYLSSGMAQMVVLGTGKP